MNGARAALNTVTVRSALRLRKLAAGATGKETKNKAIVALANRHARIAFALLRGWGGRIRCAGKPVWATRVAGGCTQRWW